MRWLGWILAAAAYAVAAYWYARWKTAVEDGQSVVQQYENLYQLYVTQDGTDEG